MNLLLSLLATNGLLLVQQSAGYTSYIRRIPNGFNVIAPDGTKWAAVGHGSPNKGSSLNDFGRDFKASNFVWTQALCQADSDGDGKTNGEELGDPECVWQEGMEPAITENITHPGIFNEDFDAVPPISVGSEQTSAETLVLPTWLAAHIACMMLAWGFLLPVGALMAISFRHSFADKARWFQLHVSIQVLGLVLSVVGFILPFVNVETHFRNTHQIMGTVVFSLGIVQALQGFIRPAKTEKPTMIRKVWEVCHKWFGRVIIVLAWVTSFMGIKLVKMIYSGAPGVERVMAACKAMLGIQIALVVVLTLASFYKSKPSTTTTEEKTNKTTDQAMETTNHTQAMVSGEMSTELDYDV